LSSADSKINHQIERTPSAIHRQLNVIQPPE